MLFHTERVEQVRLLGVFFISSLKAILHVDTMLSDINQRLYIDSQLKAQGLASDSLQIIFHALTLIIIIIIIINDNLYRAITCRRTLQGRVTQINTRRRQNMQ